ncbi:putative WEB family protein At1g65010, chloroplastic isoform X2 [Diprion similis]|uniref:putative WEB family protein At1g65010, chloroplastic isoform X2 n=1 Tax=Diprion similis TaxID=362088 RepID=UPI001EF7EB5F|nr:putative WEB family protein At1g65010, chloroplastic isoform X2 [Diprion similis]
MTDFNYCCLCASDEGIFLDIFKATHRQLGNRSLLKELETCLSVKVDRKGTLSSKICHKCAIELGECHQFVETYNQASKAASTKLKKTVTKKSCCLCFTSVKNKYLFQLAEDFQSKIDPIQKIYECFHKSITREESEGLLICLFCRYNLDILYDLKKLAREVRSKLEKITECKGVVASLPKTETFVVSRKTTVHSAAKLQYTSDSDSEYNKMAPKQLRSKRLKNLKHPQQLHFRTCGQCETLIEDGIDMYRLHRTGLTVCKACWITMDPISTRTGNKRRPNTQIESKTTRLCAVFVKDVLSAASSKDNGSCNVEKAEKDAQIYVISDHSDTEIPNTKATRKTRQKRGVDDNKSELESLSASWSRTKRSAKQEEADSDSRPNKRLKSVQNAIVTIPLEKEQLRRSTRLQSSDSEGVILQDNWSDVSEVKKIKTEEKLNTLHIKNKSGKIKLHGNSKKLKTHEAGSKSTDLPPEADTEAGKELRKVRKKVPLISEPTLPASPKTRNLAIRTKQRSASPGSKRDLKNIEKNKSSDESIANQRLPLKIKASPKRSKKLMMTLNENLEMKEITQESADASSLPDPPQVNEKLLDPEISTPAGDAEQAKGSESNTDNTEIVCSDLSSELLQGDNKSLEFESARETDTVNTLNRPLSEESTSVINNSLNVITEDIAQDSDLVNDNGSKNNQTSETKVDEIHPGPNLLTESKNDDDNNSTEEVSSEKLDKSLPEEVPTALEQTLTNTEETNVVEHTNDEDVIVAAAPSNESGEVAEKVPDLAKDEETDMRSLVVDTENLLEDLDEHTEKLEDETMNTNDVPTLNDVPALNDTNHVDGEQTETNENKEIIDDELDSVKSITEIDTVDKDPGTKNESINPSLEDNEQSMTEDITEDPINESPQDIEEPNNVTNNHALSTVTEILQEVIDLATAEVQKRGENDLVSEPETLESISKEIEKSTDKMSTSLLVKAQEKLFPSAR